MDPRFSIGFVLVIIGIFLVVTGLVVIYITFKRVEKKVFFHTPRNKMYDVCCCFIIFILRSIITENWRSYYGEWTRTYKSAFDYGFG